jgi:hypothetical protein
MIGASEREIASVAAGSGTDRISKAAVIDSLREATRTIDQGMAASVQSAALSQLQADAQGYCSREEVARVWLTNVLPALERAPLRSATGGLSTRLLTERLQRMLHGRLSQVMLDELPEAQEQLGLPADASDGRPLPPSLVQPLVASLTAAALRATVHELGEAMLALPGLEAMDQVAGGAGGGVGGSTQGPLWREGDVTGGLYADAAAPANSPPATAAASAAGGGMGDGGGISTSDAVGAAEGLVRLMLEGALHGHHFALALHLDAEASGADGGEGKGGLDGREAMEMAHAYPGSPTRRGGATAKELLQLREAQAAVLRLSDENAQATDEYNVLLDQKEEISSERNELLASNRQLDAELSSARDAADAAQERIIQLNDELHASLSARELVEADLAELRASVKSQVFEAVEASQEAARRSYDVDMKHDRAGLERELSTLRAAREAESAASAELQRRCDRLTAEKVALERERAALLAERSAITSRSTAEVRHSLSPTRATLSSPLRSPSSLSPTGGADAFAPEPSPPELGQDHYEGPEDDDGYGAPAASAVRGSGGVYKPRMYL